MNQTASQIADVQRGRRRSASSDISASGRNSACCACRCGIRVSVCALNAIMTPAAIPAAQSLVHRATTRHIAHPVSAKPASSTMLNASTGDAPSHSIGAAIASWTSIVSE